MALLYLAGCSVEKESEAGPMDEEEAASNESAGTEAPTQKQDSGTLPAGKPPSKGEDFHLTDLGLQMVWIDRGTFTMGSANPTAAKNEKPQTLVTLSQGFWIARTETRQDLYEQLTGENPSLYKNDGQPVENLAFFDARAFCRKLTEHELSKKRLYEGYKYRLPTEVQWEFAARGGRKRNTDEPPALDKAAWHRANSANTPHPVATRKQGLIGLHDMFGNVFEFCEGFAAPYPGRHVVDWVGQSKSRLRVARGGSWFSPMRECSPSFRLELPPDFPTGHIGFRVVLIPPTKAGGS